MNILYLIGNGFDLAQGLKTSYQDFYEYLKTQTPINSVAELMMKEIQGQEIELWKDMELGLGKLTDKVKDKALFEEFYYDLCDKLREYLISQDDSYTPTKEITEKYIRDLVCPEDYLSNLGRRDYINYFNQFGDNRMINIVSFNYTDVFSKAIDATNPKLVLPSNRNNYYLQPILNIHGKLNTPYILMGVNDESQILNPEFAQDEDVWDYLLKPQSNYEIGTLIDSRVEQMILESHLIVTMGLSFGETDLNWWQTIGTRLKNGGKIKIIVFSYVKDLPVDLRKHQPIRRAKKKEFLIRCGFEENEHYKYIDNVNVCLNGGLFSPRSVIFNNGERLGL